MTGPSGINMAASSASEHHARYERLRNHALGSPRAGLARDGLAVFLRQGTAAWLDTCSELPSPAALATQNEHQTSPLPEGTNAELVHVLAAMAMEHFQEVYV